MKFLIVIMTAVGIVLWGYGQEKLTGNLKQSKSEADRESALDTVAYINQMNYAYTVMNTYHNVLAVQEEYEKISIDRIDVTRIPSFSHDNKAMLTLIESMLDSLKALKMTEDDYKYYQEVMEDNRRRAKKDMWMNLVATVPFALKDAGKVVTKQAGTGDAYTVSFQALLTLAGDLIGGPVETVMNYNKTLDTLRANNKERQFNYNKSKEKEVHEANKKLIKAEFEFVKDKKLKREDIVTPDELQSLVDMLKNGKPDRVYKQLNTDYMRSHYRMFAAYWYYLASFAVQNKDYAVALEAADTFFTVHRDLLKVDPMVAQTAIAGVTALIAMKSDDHEKIRGWIKKICDVNYNNVNPDYSYFCADVLYHVLNDPQGAIEILNQSNAYIEGCFEAKLLTYRNKYSEGEMSLGKNDLPADIDLIRIRTLYNDILAEKKSDDLTRNILEICENQTTSSLEKLFYIGRVRVKDLWQEAKKDVLAIKVRYVRPKFRSNKFVIEIPVSWFILGEVESKIFLCKGDKEVVIIDESIEERKIRKSDAGVGSDVVSLTFFCRGNRLPGVDSVKLVFEHKTWPIQIAYKPSLAFDVQSGKGENSETTYTPVKIKFMGAEKDLIAPPENVKETILKDKLDKYTHCLLPFQYGKTEYCTNFLTAVTIGQDRSFKVAYTNPTPYKTHINLKVGYYSKYGARLCNINLDDVEINPYTGDTWCLEWPKDMLGSELPSQVLFQYHIEDGVWDKWKNYLIRRNVASELENKSEEQKDLSKE